MALGGAIAAFVASWSGGMAGCADPDEAVSFEAEHPAARIRAIKVAARTEDREAIPHLIESLDSEDPMQRLLAIRALEKITGQTLGYEHASPWWQRNEAVLRWVEWAREQGLAEPRRTADEWSGAEPPGAGGEIAGEGVLADVPAVPIPAAPIAAPSDRP